MNKPAQGFPRAGFYPTILPMKLRTPHYGWRSLYLPPPGLLLMQVRVPVAAWCSKSGKIYDRGAGTDLRFIEDEWFEEFRCLKGPGAVLHAWHCVPPGRPGFREGCAWTCPERRSGNPTAVPESARGNGRPRHPHSSGRRPAACSPRRGAGNPAGSSGWPCLPGNSGKAPAGP